MFKIILGLITAVVASLHVTPAQAAQKANETDATTSATYVLSTPAKAQKAVVTGAERTSEYLKLLKGKRVALFGSYGWGDGEWMRTWESDCDSAGVNLVCESVICTEPPDDAALEACRALGKALVE